MSADVFLPSNKEPRFYGVAEGDPVEFNGPGDAEWAAHIVQERHEYEALFRPALPGQLRGEGSTDYLYRSHMVAPRLRADAPLCRLIVMLRDPRERAYSNWLHHLRDGREVSDFADALAEENSRIAAGWAWWWYYLRRGLYGQQLVPYFECFPRDQILVLRYEELLHSPQAVLDRVREFLGIRKVRHASVGKPVNQSVIPRSRLHYLVRRRVLSQGSVAGIVRRSRLPKQVKSHVRRWVDAATLHQPPMSNEAKRNLTTFFASDLAELSHLTGIDVSLWQD